MNEYIIGLTIKYRNTGLVVDTNLLVLYLVGKFNLQEISNCKRTKSYTKGDFITLSSFMANFKNIVTTPNILTEVSNLTETYNANSGKLFFPSFHLLIKSLSETHILSMAASSGHCFPQYGLTDSCIHELANMNHLVLTDDLRFYGYLESRSLPVINFNHLRSAAMLK